MDRDAVGRYCDAIRGFCKDFFEETRNDAYVHPEHSEVLMIPTDAEIKQQIVDSFPRLAPADLTGFVYEQRIAELSLDANMRDGYRLIGYFDSFCELLGIRYFAMGNTLAAAVTYHDFIPGSSKIEIGMLRIDYRKLLKAHSEFLAFCNAQRDAAVNGPLEKGAVQGASDVSRSAVNPTGFVLDLRSPGFGNPRRRLPLVKLSKPEVIVVDESIVYSDDHLPMKADAVIEISVMDAIPNDYDLQRVLFKSMALLNRRFDRAKGFERAALAKTIWALADTYNSKPHQFVARLFPTRSKSAPMEDLFPLRKLDFGPVKIACPNKTTTWVYENAESQRRQVAILQSDAMRITKEIDRICRKHGIGYFICGGTMLGLVRHGGFIPWDDDMDVGMLRADYERFLEVAPDELDDELFLQTRRSDPNIPYLFSKVRIKDSEYITAYNEMRDFDKGICVDVFPFDKIPIEDGTFDEHYANVKKLIQAHNKIANRQVPAAMPHDDASNPAEVLGKAIMEARHRHYWSKSLADTQQAYDEAVTSYNDRKDLHYVASFVSSFTMAHLDDILPYKDVEFEGVTLSCIAHPEVFLQMQYGDYMTMPMPHQQRGHGLLRWRDAEHCSEEFE